MKKATLFSGIVCAMASVGLCISESQAEVSVKSGKTLTLTGDSFGDAVEVLGIGPNQVSVSVNGGAAVVYGEVQNIKIDMKKGFDVVGIADLEISGNLEVNTGGDLGDTLIIENSLVNGNATFKGSSDSVMDGCNVGKTLTVEAGLPFDIDGDGVTMLVNDAVVTGKATLKGSAQSIDLLQTTNNFVANDLSISLGGGADAVAIDGNIIGRNLTLDGGSGTDILLSGLNLFGGKISVKGFELLF